ncbi:hypothetical protein [Kitasatospora sp. NPDC015120]|uniref:hypothetical protein n=1 Tax=Kitasatospora sp. NPDC015120 TaxID=3364023 RepID=UPI0036F486FA
MIQHMNMVFAADGLSTGEGAFLLACCNHTDDRGYVIASMRQLADEAHMKMTAARDNKQRLIKRGLLAAGERYSPRNGARIADLYRVNLTLLASMARAPRDYGPSLVEELSFAEPHETPSSDPPSDSVGGSGPAAADPPSDSVGAPSDSVGAPTESEGTPPTESDPLLLPSSVPSPLPARAGTRTTAATQAPDERESQAAPQKRGGRKGGHLRAAALEQPQEPAVDPAVLAEAESVVDVYAQASGRPMVNGTRTALLTQVTEHLAAGYPAEWLADRAREMAVEGWLDLAKHALKSKVPLPGQRPEQAPAPARPVRELCDECRDEDGLVYTRDPLTGVERPLRCSHGRARAVAAGQEAGA